MDLHARKTNKSRVWELLEELDCTEPGSFANVLSKYYADDAVFEVFHPFNTIHGIPEAAEAFWEPLADALPDMEHRVDIFAGDLYKDEYWITAMGHICGTFTRPWLGIQPTRKILFLRKGEFHKVKDGRIVKTHILLDIPDVMRQAGFYPFRPMPGTVCMQPGPKMHNGIRLGDDDPRQDALDTVLGMHKALHDYDGKDLASMQHSHCWSDHFIYFAPAGIGAVRGMDQFKADHQQPFLNSFPDRHGTEHYCRISDGPIACTTHWGTLTATHTGSKWLNLPATHKKLKMRVADWYCADDTGKLHENWLFMDIPDICMQLGVDILSDINRSGS
ncbi:MAG: hypothetical protein D3926_21855 [Desulfobacteraceae bacterium]|nr:MAG: hypothetical protein D3926_21855 [Desulfobacteraceae bacterium]